MSCSFCYRLSNRFKCVDGSDLDIHVSNEQINWIIRNLDQMKGVSFSYGEFFLPTNKIQRVALSMSNTILEITTNGTCVDLSLVKKLVDNNDSVQITLSSYEETIDWLEDNFHPQELRDLGVTRVLHFPRVFSRPYKESWLKEFDKTYWNSHRLINVFADIPTLGHNQEHL